MKKQRGGGGVKYTSKQPVRTRFDDEDEETATPVDLLNLPIENTTGDEKSDLIFTVGLLALVFIVYFLTLFPSVPGGL